MAKIKYWLICLLVTGVYALPQACTIKGGGVVDNILLQFGNAATGWHNTIEPITKKFFFILFGMEFMWQLTVKKVFAGDIEKLWVFFFTRTVLCFFFAKYLINIEMYRGIIEFFANVGGKIGGYNLNLAPGNGLNVMSPSAILSNFSCMADMIHAATDNTSSFDYVTLKITLAIIQVIMFIVLIFIAYYLMQILLQAYLLIYAGFIFAGFAGSAWTKSYWEKYISATISIGAKFLVVSLLLGVINVQIQSWSHDINEAMNNSDLNILAQVIFRVFGVAIIISMALWQLPEWFAGVLNGQISSVAGSSSGQFSIPLKQEGSSNKSVPDLSRNHQGGMPNLVDIASGRAGNFTARSKDNNPNPL